MGIVVDVDIAKATPCHGYKIDEEYLLWSPGVIGMLSDAQEKVYCTEVKIAGAEGEIPPKLKERWKFFKEAAKKCSEKTKGETDRLPKFLSCMSEEAKRRGIKI